MRTRFLFVVGSAALLCAMSLLVGTGTHAKLQFRLGKFKLNLIHCSIRSVLVAVFMPEPPGMIVKACSGPGWLNGLKLGMEKELGSSFATFLHLAASKGV